MCDHLPGYVEVSLDCAFPGCEAKFRRLLRDQGTNQQLLNKIGNMAEFAGWQVDHMMGPSDRLTRTAWDYCPEHNVITVTGVRWQGIALVKQL